MSFIVNKEIPCTNCQFPNEVEVWSIVNVKEDPELKDILLGGEFNMAECRSCKKIFYAENFVLYHDPDMELMAFVYPYSDRVDRAGFEEQTRQSFEQYKLANTLPESLTYEPITMFGLDELVDLVIWEDEAQIQSEIAEHLLDKGTYEFKKLKPAFYRQHRLPLLLPFEKNKPMVNNELLWSAVHQIVAVNGRLNIFSTAETYLREHPQLTLEFSKPIS